MSALSWFVWGFIALFVLRWFWRRRTLRATVCGHHTKIKGSVTAFGETVQGRLSVIQGKTPYCHTCLGKMSIQCAWCGKPIFIGHRVTLYLKQLGVRMPDHAVPYQHEESGQLSYVGCMRCADLGFADAHGAWVPSGRVERIPSPTEIALAAFRQGATAVIFRQD